MTAKESKKQGWTDAELQDTWMAMIPVHVPSAILACVRQAVKEKHAENTDAAVFKGCTYETDAHVTVAMALPAHHVLAIHPDVLAKLTPLRLGESVLITPPVYDTTRLHPDLLSAIADLKLGPSIRITLGRRHVLEQRDRKFEDGKLHSYDVVVMDVLASDGSPLRRLHEALLKVGEVIHPFDEYRPHVTLAYVRAGTGQYIVEAMNHAIGTDTTAPPSYAVDAIVFKRFRDRTTPPLVLRFASENERLLV